MLKEVSSGRKKMTPDENLNLNKGVKGRRNSNYVGIFKIFASYF